MRAGNAFRYHARAAGALLVLLALLLRFAIPSGYMLAGDGALAIMPCPSGGALPGIDGSAAAAMPAMALPDMAMPDTAMSDMPMAHGPDHQPAQPESRDCPYGVLAAPVLPPPPPVLAPRVLLAFLEAARAALDAVAVRALAAPPPPSRGPPLS